jgi:hypothetical protein
MRHVRFLPFTFLSGAHGFALFAPYMIVVMAIFFIRGRRRALVPQPVPIQIPVAPARA